MRSRVPAAFAACVTVAAILVSAVAPSRAVADASGTLQATSLIGLARGEAASLNFTNVSREVVQAALVFLDRDGRRLKASRARVSPGQSLSLGLSFGEVATPRDVRVQIRVIVLAQPPDPDAQPPDPDADPPTERMLASLEVFDERTGKSAYGLLLPAVPISATGGAGAGIIGLE